MRRRATRVSRFSLKTKVDEVVWLQNHWDGFFRFGQKPVMKVSPSLASKPIVGFLFEPQNKGGGGFPGFGIKIGSYSLVIWASKSPQWFLCLGIKIKQATVYRLRYKTDGRATA
jgi:hypothetical protein